jgi:hypothetical protein
LYAFGQAFGLPDVSPFVTKVETLLKMAGLDYTINTKLRMAAGKIQGRAASK